VPTYSEKNPIDDLTFYNSYAFQIQNLYYQYKGESWHNYPTILKKSDIVKVVEKKNGYKIWDNYIVVKGNALNKFAQLVGREDYKAKEYVKKCAKLSDYWKWSDGNIKVAIPGENWPTYENADITKVTLKNGKYYIKYSYVYKDINYGCHWKEVRTAVVQKKNGNYVMTKNTTNSRKVLCDMKNTTKKVTRATTSKNGKIEHRCMFCDKIVKKTTIYKASKVSLSKKIYEHDGKVKNPTVIVRNSKGKKIDLKYYTVTKPAGRKEVGKYTYTVKFKGRYKGTKSLTLTIK